VLTLSILAPCIIHRREKGTKGRTVKEGMNRVGKKGFGPSFFHSPFVFPFVHFLMDNVNAFCLWLHQTGAKSKPKWQPRTTLY
jgi:hypothetical protein